MVDARGGGGQGGGLCRGNGLVAAQFVIRVANRVRSEVPPTRFVTSTHLSPRGDKSRWYVHPSHDLSLLRE